VSERLRVAMVAPSLRILGGHSVQADALLARWKDDPAVDAWLVPVNPEPPSWLAGAARIKYVRTLVTQLTYWPLLWRELARADVVHVFAAAYTSFLLAPIPAIAVAACLGRPVLLNYHSGEAPDHLRRSRIARFFLRRVAAIVVQSRFLVDVFRRFGLRAEAIANVVDRERFAYRERERIAPRILSTRNLEPNYNVACTLRAFARIQARRPDATLTVVGAGSQRPAIEALAHELDLRGVSFAGRVAPHDMARYYADAGVYVQTPAVDNMPLSVLEAFASGVPVVSTDTGGVSAILTPEIHGLLAPPDDDAAIAEAVLELLDDPARARRLAAAAYRSTDAFTWVVVREAWLSAYARLARPVPLPRPAEESA
jgi:glycosyltransferase involved in cell wall biosynthesis